LYDFVIHYMNDAFNILKFHMFLENKTLTPRKSSSDKDIRGI